MANRLWPVFGFFIKAGLAAGSVYFVYEQGLLGSSSQGQAALRRAQETIPATISYYSDILSKHMGVSVELPPTPSINVNFRDHWNSGINSLMSSLSSAPSTIQEYSREALNYVKGQK